MQPKTHHFGWTAEETIVQLHGVGPWGVTYVNPADDPRNKWRDILFVTPGTRREASS
jgi:hypothetical protein